MRVIRVLMIWIIVYYLAGLAVMLWSMKQKGRSLTEFANVTGLSRVRGGVELLALIAAVIVPFFWPICIIDQVLSNQK